MDKTQLIRIVKERYKVPQQVAEFLALVLFAGEVFDNEKQVVDYLGKLEELGKYIKL